MKLFSGINFRDYLADYYFWQDNPVKNKKRFKTILMVLYGKKKDRGGVRKKYAAAKQKYYDDLKTVRSAVNKYFSQIMLSSEKYF